MRTQEELAAFSDEHLNYEVAMLWHACCILYSIWNHPKENYLSVMFRNTYLDSFAVHARVLHDFFYPKPSHLLKDDDITVNDYVADWNPVKSELMNTVTEKANKQVAHLTYKRIAYEKTGKHWNWLELLEEFVGLLSQFGNSAKPGYMGPEIQKLIKGLSAKQIRVFKAVSLSDGTSQTGLTFSADDFLGYSRGQLAKKERSG